MAIRVPFTFAVMIVASVSVCAQSTTPPIPLNRWQAVMVGVSNDGVHSGLLAQYLSSSPVESRISDDEFAMIFAADFFVNLNGEHTPDYIEEAIPHNGIKSLKWYQQPDLGLRLGFGGTIVRRVFYTATFGCILRNRILLAESDATGWYWWQDSDPIGLFTWGAGVHMALTMRFRLGFGYYYRQGATLTLGGAW